MISLENEKNSHEIFAVYLEKRRRLKSIIDSESRDITVGQKTYHIKVKLVNPFTTREVPPDGCMVEPRDLTDELIYQNMILQENPNNFVGIITQYEEKGDDINLEVHAATVSNHPKLAGCLLDIGLPFENVSTANNLGINIPYTSDAGEVMDTCTRYKFDMKSGNDDHRYFHVWTRRPVEASKREAIRIRGGLTRISRALDQVVTPLAQRTLKNPKVKNEYQLMTYAQPLKDHSLNENRYISSNLESDS